MGDEPDSGSNLLINLPYELLVSILSYSIPYLFVIRRCSKSIDQTIKIFFPEHCHFISLTQVISQLDDENEEVVFSFMDWLNKEKPETFIDKEQNDSFRVDILATKCGKISVLKWYCQRKRFSLKDIWYCTKAAEREDIRLLKWLKSEEAGNCEWNPSLCAVTAKNGNLDTLKILRSGELGEICPWDIETCKEAIKNGHLHILEWIRNKDIHGKDVCPWDDVCVELAIETKQKEILIWLRDKKIHGEEICPWDLENCYTLASESPEILEWLNENS